MGSHEILRYARIPVDPRLPVIMGKAGRSNLPVSDAIWPVLTWGTMAGATQASKGPRLRRAIRHHLKEKLSGGGAGT
jgi:hypothetical protein